MENTPQTGLTCPGWGKGFSLGLIATGLLLLGGCAYRLGPTNGLAAGAKSVEVKPFINQTLEPRLTDPVTFQVRKQLQRDGTYRLASHEDGEILVTGVLTRFERFELSLAPRDSLTVRDFRLFLSAQVTATDRATGKVLFNRPVNGVTLVRVGSDLTSAERQALPLLAADLARNITSMLADGTW